MLVLTDGVPDCFPLSDVFPVDLTYWIDRQLLEYQRLANLGKC